MATTVLEKPMSAEQDRKAQKNWEPLRLRGASLQDVKDGDKSEVIAIGWMDIGALGQLKVDDYQREDLSAGGTKRTALEKAVQDGARLPTIVIGMRGDTFDAKRGDMWLENPCYLIDGLQRVSAMKAHAEKYPDSVPDLHISAEVRFNTTKESEKALFQTLNIKRTPMSPNVILKNAKDTNAGILTLYGLTCNDAEFPLYKKVSWGQRMAKGQLLTAMNVVRAADMLHRHVEMKMSTKALSTRGGGSHLERYLHLIDRKSESIGLRIFRENVAEFFDVIDTCWGIRTLEYSARTTQLRGNFLSMLAKMFADHDNFWDGPRLSVDASVRKKLSSFDITDDNFARLAAAGSQALPIIYATLVEHFNKGKRENRLVPRATPVNRDSFSTKG